MTAHLADFVRAARVPDDGPSVEQEIFGTHEPGTVAAWYSRLCTQVLGSPIAAPLFYVSSSGCVAGVELADGRQLSVKAHQRRSSLDLLQLIDDAQRRLASAGFACPMPEIAPVRFEQVFVTVEQLLFDPGMRVLAPEEMSASAAALAEAAGILREVDPTPWAGLHTFHAAPGALYPEPHSPLFDFTLQRDDEEVVRVDELAAAAIAARDRGDAPLALFHCDWSARNIRLRDGRLIASYDWDSLDACRESAAVGNAAATWRSTGEPDDPPAPGPDEIDAYLDAYLEAAGPDEHRRRCGRSLRAWRVAAMGEALWLLAYTARCEHAIEARFSDERPRRARDTLVRHRTAFLAALEA